MKLNSIEKSITKFWKYTIIDVSHLWNFEKEDELNHFT